MEQLVARQPVVKASAVIADAPPGQLGFNGDPDQPPPPRREGRRVAGAEAQAMPGLDVRLIRLYRRYARLAGIAAAALAGTALLGWIAGIPLLASLDPAWVTMKVNTAVALFASGIGLVLATPNGKDQPARAAAVRVCAGLVAAIGFASLAEMVFGQDFGIDQLLIAEPPGATGTMVPGRMAPATAGSFALFGLALLAHVARRSGFASTLPTLLVLIYSVLALVGYLFGARELYSFAGHFTWVAFPTALAFLLLSSGLLVIGSERGVLRWLASPRSGGVMLRRLLPVIVCVPVLITWLRLQGQAAGLFSTVEFGAAAVAVANIILLSGVLLWAAAQLDRSDEARLRGEASRIAAQYARSLLEASLDPLVTISAEGKITDVNQATEAATGVPRAHLIGSDFSDYFTEPEKARAGYRQVFSEGQVRDYPLAIRHVSGRVADVLYNASLYRGEKAEIAGVFAAARDITERKQAEDQLRASEQRYHMLVDTMNDGLLLIDENLTITFVNARFAEMLGYAEADIIGHRSPEFMDEASARSIPAAVERRKAGIAERYEITWLRREGHAFPSMLSARPIFDQDRHYRGSLSIVIDLTEIKRAEQELTQYRQHLEELVETRTADLSKANALLEAANKELEAFSYSVSHDLRAPLRAIDGFSQILIEDYADKLDAEGQRVINVVRDGTRKMGRLIDDILAFSRVGRLEMARGAIDMDAMARAVLEDLAPLAAGRKLSVEIKPLPAAFGDVAMMQRVWTNLLDNALKFTRPKEPAIIEVGARTEGKEIIYYVKDNGVGFDMQYVDKLFGVFQRLHGVDEFPGTGIGLAIVKRIIARHGGRVWAEAKVNEGATFYFALPAQEMKNG